MTACKQHALQHSLTLGHLLFETGGRSRGDRPYGRARLPTVYKLRAVAKRHRLMTSRFCRAERAAGCKAAKHGKCSMQIVASAHEQWACGSAQLTGRAGWENFSACTQLGPKLASTLTIEACQQDKRTALHETHVACQIMCMQVSGLSKAHSRKQGGTKEFKSFFPNALKD